MGGVVETVASPVTHVFGNVLGGIFGGPQLPQFPNLPSRPVLTATDATSGETPEEAEKRRRQAFIGVNNAGLGGTLLTTPSGVLGQAPVDRKQLLGQRPPTMQTKPESATVNERTP